MRISVLVFAAAMLTAAPAFAQTDPTATTEPAVTEPAATTTETAPTTEPTTEAAATESAAPERICRTVQRTESRLRSRRERICHTEAEWDQMARDGASLVNNARAPRPEN